MSDQILHVNSAHHVRDRNQFSKLTIDPISKTTGWPNGADLAPEALYELPAVDQVA